MPVVNLNHRHFYFIKEISEVYGIIKDKSKLVDRRGNLL